MNPKVALAILVVAVLLVAVALGTGLRGGVSSTTTPSAGPLGSLLGGVLVTPLDLQTVTAQPSSCIVGQQVVVMPGGSCALTVPKAGPASRRLTLSQGTVSVTFTPADGSFGAQTVSMPARTTTFDVIGAGGKVDVTCQQGGQFCVLRGAT